MTKQFLTIAMLAGLFLNACKDTLQQENIETTTTQTLEADTNATVNTTSIDKDGNILDIDFNNTKGTATLNFNGETIELIQKQSASGFWYHNNNYELRGKGNDIELKKDGTLVFEHKDDMVHTTLKNKDSQTLDMTFNNTEGTAKIYLNGGEQIDLVAEKAASGIWYKNEQYELRGKGDALELTKDGVTVFKN